MSKHVIELGMFNMYSDETWTWHVILRPVVTVACVAAAAVGVFALKIVLTSSIYLFILRSLQGKQNEVRCPLQITWQS